MSPLRSSTDNLDQSEARKLFEFQFRFLKGQDHPNDEAILTNTFGLWRRIRAHYPALP